MGRGNIAVSLLTEPFNGITICISALPANENSRVLDIEDKQSEGFRIQF